MVRSPLLARARAHRVGDTEHGHEADIDRPACGRHRKGLEVLDICAGAGDPSRSLVVDRHSDRRRDFDGRDALVDEAVPKRLVRPKHRGKGRRDLG